MLHDVMSVTAQGLPNGKKMEESHGEKIITQSMSFKTKSIKAGTALRRLWMERLQLLHHFSLP